MGALRRLSIAMLRRAGRLASAFSRDAPARPPTRPPRRRDTLLHAPPHSHSVYRALSPAAAAMPAMVYLNVLSNIEYYLLPCDFDFRRQRDCRWRAEYRHTA